MNESNLRTLSPSEAREQGRLGGIRSGEARRERKAIRQALEECLAMETDLDGETVTNVEAIAAAMVRKAREGDVRAFVEVRNSVGERPAERIDMNAPISEETRREIDAILFGIEQQAEEMGADDER